MTDVKPLSAKDSEKANLYTQALIIIATLAALVALATFMPEPAPAQQLPAGAGQQQQQEASPQP